MHLPRIQIPNGIIFPAVNAHHLKDADKQSIGSGKIKVTPGGSMDKEITKGANSGPINPRQDDSLKTVPRQNTLPIRQVSTCQQMHRPDLLLECEQSVHQYRPALQLHQGLGWELQ